VKGNIRIVLLKQCSIRTAGLVQEIEKLKKQLAACTRDNLNLQEELSEAYRIKVRKLLYLLAVLSLFDAFGDRAYMFTMLSSDPIGRTTPSRGCKGWSLTLSAHVYSGVCLYVASIILFL